MNKLVKKEWKLALHPTAVMFLALSSMLLIPNYPYYVIFFYTSLAVFFICLTGRENNDIPYTLSLPVRKRDIVKGRFAFVVQLELLQALLAVPFAILRQSFDMPGNQVGMDANIALFGLSFVMLGLFNLVFFGVYYKDVAKVGKAFVLSSTAIAVFMIVAEAAAHAVPFVRDRLDTPDPQFLPEKLIVLAVGVVLFALLTALAYRKSVRSFEALDL